MSQENLKLCPNCDQNIESSKYFLHERMCFLNVKKCPKCNKPYNIDDLNDHIQSAHSYTICDLCNIKIPNSEIEEHKNNCLCQLTPCKYCQLNVILKELEEHENICGSTTEKCSKCGLYIEKRNYTNHVCLNKEIEYFNENIIIDNEEEIKKEKKKIKHGLEKNSFKQNKILIEIDGQNNKGEKNNNIKNQKYENNYKYNYKETKKKKGTKNNKNENNNIDLNVFYTPEEIKDQIKEFNRYKKINYINNLSNNNNNDKKKKKNKNKDKEDKKEEIEKLNEDKNKKGKKGKIQKNYKNNKIHKDDEDNKYFDEDEYYEGKKNINLHDVKWDIPPDKYKNYNNITNYDYNYGYNNLEEELLQEAIKLSLKEK